MKVSKAIEILTRQEIRHRTGGDSDYHDAIKLGIEALKAVEEDEYRGTEVPRPLLPGETPEEEVEND